MIFLFSVAKKSKSVGSQLEAELPSMSQPIYDWSTDKDVLLMMKTERELKIQRAYRMKMGERGTSKSIRILCAPYTHPVIIII